jgi:SRSO17 transposase
VSTIRSTISVSCVCIRFRIPGYFTLASTGTTVQRLVNVAGCRWSIEECFEQAQQITGLDEYEVRSWHTWLESYVAISQTVCRSPANFKFDQKSDRRNILSVFFYRSRKRSKLPKIHPVTRRLMEAGPHLVIHSIKR